MTLRSLFLACTALPLAACGSGEEFDPSVEFQNRADAAQVIYDQTTVMTTTPLADMSASPSATYTGVASALAELPEGDIEATYADVAMTADFDNDEVSGTLSNWYGNTIGPIAGTVTLSGGSITGTDWAAAGAGTLSADGESGNVAITLDGEFLGADAAAMQGTFSGTITYSGAPTGDLVGSVDALRD